MNDSSLWQIIPSPETLFFEVSQFFNRENFPKDLICDHICYRVESLDRYSYLKHLLQKFGTLKNESLVNGRHICIFQMPSAMTFHGLQTDCIELPAPKLNFPYQEGWEHAEFVTNSSLTDFMNIYSHYAFETHALHKKINAEISLQISDRKRIKFHEHSILDVIALELATSC